ncbi:MAG: acetyl-CoA carboxylase biotin carboxylase subunit [Melioribacteraceae bacterium]|nr:acetyl-CoA carboxylase biotin carboxylase subunit [Melioribacteraceae bacterium]
MFKKILIANRGEIAVRIINACKELGIKACVIYSEADKDSLHVLKSDEAYYIGPAPARESYLNIDKIIDTVKKNKIEAVHPGYGFLAENARFIKRIESEGVTFIGPPAAVVELMGEKTAARRFVQEAGVPIVPGTTQSIKNNKQLKEIASEIGFPIILKAAAGGGGKGMRIVRNAEELEESFERAGSESLKAFGDDRIYIEKYIVNPKHIEVQVLSDKQGNHLHLFERECSIQRRHQKIIEEAPSSSINEKLRERITTAAISITKACNYLNAGTIEMLLDENNNFYFLEMNTRLQVEHPVTELITGVDIVKEQISIAAGNPISFRQSELKMSGCAVECRINAEDPHENFLPSTGTISDLTLPNIPGIRIDNGIRNGYTITSVYDSLMMKVISWDKSRSDSIKKMQYALKNLSLSGIICNIPLHLRVLNSDEFILSRHSINFLEGAYDHLTSFSEVSEGKNVAASAILGAYIKYQRSKLAPSKIGNNDQNKWTNSDEL